MALSIFVLKKIYRLISNFLFKYWPLVFGFPFLYKLNILFYQLSLKGIGILNHQNNRISGEDFLFKKYFRNDQNVKIIYDVGANIGKLTKRFQTVYPHAKIVCIEPHPQTFEKLKSNLSPNENIMLRNTALGKHNGEAQLYDYNDKGSSHASLNKDVFTSFHNSSSVGKRVPLKTLDTLASELNHTHIDILKVDVEGFEYDVLLGSERLLSQNKINLIIFEFNQMNLLQKVTFLDFWKLLSPQYNIYRLLTHGLIKVAEYNSIESEIFAFQNIVAVNKKSDFINHL